MHENEAGILEILKKLEGVYDQDPVHFEKLRGQVIDMTITHLPEEFQKRARGLQFVIDSELSKYKDPVSRMNRMVELFWEKFHEFNAAVNDPAGTTLEREKKKKKAKVFPLH